MEVKFHDIGEGMTEGEIIQYFVAVGDEVVVDQPLVEVQTDKMVAEIPSPSAGKVQQIYYQVGETIKVGSVILEIATNETAKKKTSKETQSTKTSTNQHQSLQQMNSLRLKGRVLATPYTRKIARDHQVNIEEITGSGPAGRVLDEDVYRFIKAREKQILSPPETEIEVPSSPILQQTDDMIPFKGIRKQIAKKMSDSLKTIPHVTHFEEIDVTNVVKLRQQLKEIGEQISIVAFFIKVLAIALKEYRIFNATLDEKNEVIKLKKQYHFGLATDTERGLMVPVLKDVNKKSLKDIHLEMKELTKKAQTNKLTLADMQNGTFTISNVGPLGGIGATPIINHPEAAIMAFHKTKKVPVVTENDEIVIRSLMNVSFSFDHRVADGAEAVTFTNRFAELIEQPNKLLLELV